MLLAGCEGSRSDLSASGVAKFPSSPLALFFEKLIGEFMSKGPVLSRAIDTFVFRDPVYFFTDMTIDWTDFFENFSSFFISDDSLSWLDCCCYRVCYFEILSFLMELFSASGMLFESFLFTKPVFSLAVVIGLGLKDENWSSEELRWLDEF